MISMLTLPEDNLVFCIVTQSPECALGTSFCHKAVTLALTPGTSFETTVELVGRW